MTKKVTRADGIVTYVVEEFLDSIVEEGDTVEDMENYEARRYLAETDWYVTRKAETGKAIPDDILTKRQEAREKVIEL